MEHEGSAMLQGRYVPLLQFRGKPACLYACLHGAVLRCTVSCCIMRVTCRRAAILHLASSHPLPPPAGVQHEELLLRLKVHRSAAGIAEAICSKAADLGADAVLIASHGAGVLADFGSVARCAAGAGAHGCAGVCVGFGVHGIAGNCSANRCCYAYACLNLPVCLPACRRWASENSKVPAILLPPATMDPAAASMPAAPSVVVAGADNLAALQDAFEWTLQKVAKPGAPLGQSRRAGTHAGSISCLFWSCAAHRLGAA
jgi:hypothetical protein